MPLQPCFSKKENANATDTSWGPKWPMGGLPFRRQWSPKWIDRAISLTKNTEGKERAWRWFWRSHTEHEDENRADGRLVSQWAVPTDPGTRRPTAPWPASSASSTPSPAGWRPSSRMRRPPSTFPRARLWPTGPSSPRSSRPSPAYGPTRRGASRTRARSPWAQG